MLAGSIVASLLLAAPALAGGGFDASQVDAEATWVLHVDFHALSRSSLLRTLHREGLHAEDDLELDHVKKDFGVDPFTDLHSLTMYSAGKRGEGVVTVVKGSTQLDSAWSRLAERAEPVRIGGREALRFEARGSSTRFVILLASPEYSSRLAVFATSSEALESALEVLSGDAPHLGSPQRTANPGPGLAAAPASGSLIFAASLPGVLQENLVFLRRALRLLKELASIKGKRDDLFALQVRGLEFELCESKGELSARLAIEAPSGDGAAQMAQILNDSISPLSSAGGSPEVVTRRSSLVAGLKVGSPASKLLVGFRYPAEQFVADLVFVERNGAARSGR